MVTRVGGLASGMDIDSIVEKLMSAEKAPLNKLYQQQQKYEWERDAYREINTALKSFDDYLFDNFRLSSNFYKKTVSSTNSSLVTATANSAASGSLSIEAVSQLASSARVVGNTINASGSKKLSEMGITETSVKLNAIQADGQLLKEGVTIAIDENETVDSFLKKVNNSSVGITAIFENNKVSFTAKNTGNIATGGEIVVEAGADVFNKLLNTSGYTNNGALANNGKNAIFTINGISTEKSSNSFSLNGYTVTLHETFNSEQSLGQSFISAKENKDNADSNYNNMLNISNVSPQSLANKYLGDSYAGTDVRGDMEDKFESESTLRQDNLNNANSNLTSAQNALMLSSNFLSEEASKYNNLSKEVKDFIKGLSDEKLDEVANGNFKTITPTHLNSDEIDYLNNLTGDDLKLFEFGSTQLKEAKNAKSAGGVYNNLSAATKEFAKNHLTSTLDFDNLSGDSLTDFNKLTPDEQNALKNLNPESKTGVLTIIEKTKELELAKASLKDLTTDINTFNNIVATKQNNDAIYNAAKSSLQTALLKTATTEAQKIAIETATDDELLDVAEVFEQSGTTVPPVTLTSATDTGNMVEKIKKFVETYNGLVTTINGKLKETYDRNYPPLTEEQKEEMSEDEIEKWEKKAQTGILRNDSVLTNGLYAMRRTFMDAVGGLGDATINSLAEIGITTSSTTSDGGKLIINEDKLRDAINKNADQVAAVFTQTGTAKDVKNGKLEDTRGIGQRLRDELKSFTGTIEKKAGKSSSTNQSYTIGKRLDEVQNRIDTWLDKLKNIESRYWRQFTAMETAINKANSQSTLFQPSM